MELGFWGNYERGDWFEIDEHEMWLRRGNNADKLGVPPEVVIQFDKFADRETLLPFAWKHAPIMRWRCHGASVTFEFNSENWQQPLILIGQWGKLFAGPYLHFKMVNFRDMVIRETLWQNFDAITD